MSTHDNAPTRCIICNYTGPTISAGFHQLYAQHEKPPVPITWWECPNCGSWFGSPRPTIEEIHCNWAQTFYNDPETEAAYATFKVESQNRILDAIEAVRPEKGTVLDYGSNFGHFLEMARDRGWTAIGSDAYEEGVKATREKGFETHLAWSLEDLTIPDNSLDALVSNDVFYYVWEPYKHLEKVLALLKPGGVFVMRTSNKRSVEGILRPFLAKGERRDKTFSRLLQGQFHTVQANTITKVMTQIGFSVKSAAGAMTAPKEEYSKKTFVLYKFADFMYWLTGGGVNLSPGVLIVAVKR